MLPKGAALLRYNAVWLSIPEASWHTYRRICNNLRSLSSPFCMPGC